MVFTGRCWLHHLSLALLLMGNAGAQSACMCVYLLHDRPYAHLFASHVPCILTASSTSHLLQ
ncbi:hypothetical protein HBI70_166580 [Parastagonospora nodorum]|nr:hypothetical protein HBH49_152660 [Parastagonospora nodorum]KAH4066033.1 hypothetical protein HBH50_154170 [Parastagonospora nodorum]KAH4087710.1 hypothetical protein HBH48_136220 [Parastagonospora nodorum]KAH4187422.1 hypothetical protein HBH42_157210 [Parastagonospora nodorum]KAH4211749.1 hypothetical protein HBI95_044650 [Parastagonospora nodorum]